MASNFGTKIAINWLCVDDSDKAIGYEGGLSGCRQNADIADTLHLRDVAFLGRGAGSPSSIMWPGPRPTSMPSAILIHPAVWPQ